MHREVKTMQVWGWKGEHKRGSGVGQMGAPCTLSFQGPQKTGISCAQEREVGMVMTECEGSYRQRNVTD